jgi:hypothetical protein
MLKETNQPKQNMPPAAESRHDVIAVSPVDHEKMVEVKQEVIAVSDVSHEKVVTSEEHPHPESRGETESELRRRNRGYLRSHSYRRRHHSRPEHGGGDGDKQGEITSEKPPETSDTGNGGSEKE